jgi:DNA polymerase (family 10)
VLDKFAIAAALQEIAALLELKGGENRFKARAYRAGARAVAGYPGNLGKLVEANRLTTIRGIGNALASQINQLHLTGTSSVLDAARKEFPPGVLELAAVPGLTISRIRKLHEELGVTSLAELKTAAESGKVRNVKGFGTKTELALLAALRTESKRKSENRRIHLHNAERIASPILDYLSTSRHISDVAIAGSLRRSKETVSAIRIVAAATKPAAVIAHFLKFPLVVHATTSGRETCIVELLEGVNVTLTVVTPDKFVLALAVVTGSRSHISRLKEIASLKGFELETEEFSKANGRKKLTSEGELYARLGMQFVPPELREDQGEIEAARKNRLPTGLVDVEDIQGMVHCHTTYSDGVHSVEEMARAAEALGMKYLTITDHSPTAFYARGVTLDRLRRQWDEIDEVQQKVKVKLLKGTESDIVADGSLDYPDKVLEKFDIIVASIHSRYKMDSPKMTQRILAAVRQPVFKIWGHPLGRLLERRPPFDCDLEKILDAIAESAAAVEINGDPYRLDLEPKWIREARKRKIKFVISVDAHSTGALNNVKYGVGIARRGWVTRREVLNTLGVKAFTAAVRPVR